MGNLDPTGGSLYLGDLVLRTQNLDGDAVAVDPTSVAGTRAADGIPTPLEAAFPPEMRTTHVVVLEASQTSYGSGGVSRGGAGAGPTIQLDIPQPRPGYEQAVVSIDERGVTTWSFAPAAERQPATRSGAGSRTFTIKRPSPPRGAAEAGADRSVIGDIGKQILKVVTFPLGHAAGKVLNSFLGKWETGHQGYGVRDYGSSNYRQLVEYFDGDPVRWRELAKGRTLLMIHGTFSRAHGAFNELPPEKMTQLERLYEGRVIAFDHSSISEDPDQNIDWLIDKIPAGASLDLDIICHSRGGLVARSLTERPADRLNGRQIRVHRTALVGTVNNGTILASVEHWNDLIDTLSTVINTIGFAVSDVAELVLAFVQDFAEAASLELRGLAAMVPGGPFLKTFNVRSPRESTYLAIASNYEPNDRKLKSYFNDTVKDLIFERNENDCMVRVDSVRGSDVDGEFRRVEEHLILDGSKGIEHSRYFGHPDVADRLVSWLEAGLAVPA